MRSYSIQLVKNQKIVRTQNLTHEKFENIRNLSRVKHNIRTSEDFAVQMVRNAKVIEAWRVDKQGFSQIELVMDILTGTK